MRSRRGYRQGRDRERKHEPRPVRATAAGDLVPVGVVDPVREQREARRGHPSWSRPVSGSDRASAVRACANVAATVPSSTSQTSAIVPYGRSAKYRRKTISRRRGGSSRSASARTGSRSGSTINVATSSRLSSSRRAVLERGSQHDPPHPPVERALLAQLQALPKRAREALLHRVAGGLVVARHCRHRVAEPHVTLPVELLDRPSPPIHREIEGKGGGFL